MFEFRRGWIRPVVLAAGLAWPAAAVLAQELPSIAPQTKLRVSVVQFVPSAGDYRSWDAFGGEYVVGPDNTIFLPTLGAISVRGMGPEALAAEIGSKLQAKLGLVLAPDATVQIVSYPPIYVVGSVSTPGEYPFRPGMTVLQAVAVSGGDARNGNTAQDPAGEVLSLQASIQKSVNSILRSTARLARLDAEMSSAKQISFPPELDAKQPAIQSIMEQERTIFKARASELVRQTAAVKELIDLFNGELEVLTQKLGALDEQTQKANQELERIKKLVKDGMATVSRQTDIESSIASLRWDRLDNMIATMRAREGLSEAKRDLVKLEDDRNLDVAAAIQTEQTSIEQARLEEATAIGQLRHARELPGLLESQVAATTVSYSIVRQVNGAPAEIPAEEFTPLLPGDLLKVSVEIGRGLGSGASQAAAASDG